MSFIKEFKEFAVRGNVVDMAVGVLIGGDFGKIVSSLVNDIIMPLVGAVTKGSDFSELSCMIGDAEVKYGLFIQNIIDFVIIAFCIFLMVKGMNSLTKKKKEEVETPAEPSNEEKLLGEICDLLKNK